MLALLSALAATAAAVWLVLAYEVIVGVAAGVILVALAGLFWWMRRAGPGIATGGRPLALPAPEYRELPAPQAAPQIVNFNFFGELTEEDQRQLAAIKRAGYRAWPATERTEP